MRLHELITEGYKEAQQEFAELSDENTAKQTIDLYKELVNRNQIQGQERNIDFWRKQGWEIFSAFVNDKRHIISKTQQKNQRLKTGKSITLDENDEWLIVIPLDKDASCFHGKGTDWCTTKPLQSHFEQYFYDDETLLIYFLQKKTGKKWAISVNDSTGNEYFDIHDNMLTKDQFHHQTGITVDLYIQKAMSHLDKVNHSRASRSDLVKRTIEKIKELEYGQSSNEIESNLIRLKSEKAMHYYFRQVGTIKMSPAFRKLICTSFVNYIGYIDDLTDKDMKLAIDSDESAFDYILEIPNLELSDNIIAYGLYKYPHYFSLVIDNGYELSESIITKLIDGFTKFSLEAEEKYGQNFDRKSFVSNMGWIVDTINEISKINPSISNDRMLKYLASSNDKFRDQMRRLNYIPNKMLPYM